MKSFRSLLRFLLGLAVVSPYLIWLAQIERWQFPETQHLLRTLFSTFLQASLSSALALVFGVVLFLCAEGFARRQERKWLELILLSPNLIPPLFVVIAILSLVSSIMTFPFGLTAVIVVHALLNGGVVAVGLLRLFQNKIGGMLELAWVEGATRKKMLCEIAWPYLQSDLYSLFLFVFSICLTSFSIPLVLGGTRVASMEIAIYELIRLHGAWSQAILYALMQSLILFVLVLLMPRVYWPVASKQIDLHFLGWREGRWLVFLPVVVLFGGWWFGLSGGIPAISEEVRAVMVSSALSTLFISLSVGVLHLSLLWAVAFVLPHRGFSRFLNSYLAPSSVITGFAFLLLPGEGEFATFSKMIFALTLWSFPILYRWLGHPSQLALEKQIVVAHSLGASWTQIFRRVVWPQSRSVFLRSSGLAALWASGDFALSGILAGNQWTWALLIQDLVGSYQLELASLLLLPLFAFGILCYAVFVGWDYVYR